MVRIVYYDDDIIFCLRQHSESAQNFLVI